MCSVTCLLYYIYYVALFIYLFYFRFYLTSNHEYKTSHMQALETGIPKEAIEMAIKDRLLAGNGM